MSGAYYDEAWSASGAPARSSVFWAILIDAASTICPSTLTDPDPAALAAS